ncbi:hypothetical protein OUHCRE11_00210 [Enterobacter asburiae]
MAAANAGGSVQTRRTNRSGSFMGVPQRDFTPHPGPLPKGAREKTEPKGEYQTVPSPLWGEG